MSLRKARTLNLGSHFVGLLEFYDKACPRSTAIASASRRARLGQIKTGFVTVQNAISYQVFCGFTFWHCVRPYCGY